MKQPITFSCTEQNVAWNEKSVIDRAIEVIINNPFAEFVEMEFDVNGKWLPLSKDKVLEALSGKDKIVSFRDVGGRANGSVSRNKFVNKLRLEVMTEREEVASEVLLSFFQRAAKALPAFEKGDAGCDILIRDVYEKFDIENAPPCFTSQLGWAHIISPKGYGNYFTKEELLAIPDAHTVQQLQDDYLLIVLYEHPFDYDKEDNIAKVKKITTYLNQTRHDWKD